jgi:hypothetical protein
MTTKKTAKKSNGSTLTFTLLRETKNTYRYEEQAKVPMIGNLYLQKWAIEKMTGGEDAPTTLKLTLEV